MPRTAHDRKLLAASEPTEMYSVQRKTGIPTKKIREASLAVWNNGKYCHSRVLVYAKLIEMKVPGHEKLPGYKAPQDDNWKKEKKQ